jgi:hypothetical protein
MHFDLQHAVNSPPPLLKQARFHGVYLGNVATARTNVFSVGWPVATDTTIQNSPMVILDISQCINVTSKYGDQVLQVGGVSDETVK